MFLREQGEDALTTRISEAFASRVFYDLANAWLDPSRGEFCVGDAVRQLLLQAGYVENDYICSTSTELFSRSYKHLLTRDDPQARFGVLPVESVYKTWTSDPASYVAFAHDKGYVYGDSAFHMRYVLSELGIEPDTVGLYPDHLAVLLNVAGIIAEVYPEGLVSYVSDHLDWLSDFEAAARTRWVSSNDSLASFYLALIQATDLFVSAYLHQGTSSEGRTTRYFSAADTHQKMRAMAQVRCRMPYQPEVVITKTETTSGWTLK